MTMLGPPCSTVTLLQDKFGHKAPWTAPGAILPPYDDKGGADAVSAGFRPSGWLTQAFHPVPVPLFFPFFVLSFNALVWSVHHASRSLPGTGAP